MKKQSSISQSLPLLVEERLSARVKWDGRYAQFAANDHKEVSPLLKQWLPKLPKQGQALDIAAGAGRHSLALADIGLKVYALDISYQGLQLLKQRVFLKQKTDEVIHPIVLDLKRGWLPKIKPIVIINFFYLERALWPLIKTRLTSGCWLIIETYTVEQLKFPNKKHIRREFLLEKGELYKVFSFLNILHYEELIQNNKATAQLVGKKK